MSKNYIQIDDFVGTCVENARHIYPEYQITNNLQEKYWVSGNAERLEQVIMNLINNAVKYSSINKNISLSSKKEMGLYICSEIIKAHCGTMGVTSKLHVGSTF